MIPIDKQRSKEKNVKTLFLNKPDFSNLNLNISANVKVHFQLVYACYKISGSRFFWYD
jgi:hypothetical protein